MKWRTYLTMRYVPLSDTDLPSLVRSRSTSFSEIGLYSHTVYMAKYYQSLYIERRCTPIHCLCDPYMGTHYPSN